MKVYRRHLLVITAVVGMSLAGSAMSAALGQLEETCASCHGMDGASTASDVPTIGGMSPAYIEYNLNAYKKKERPCPETEVKSGPNKGKKTDMCEVARDIGESDIGQLAKFYAGKKFVRASQSFDAELAMKGKKIHLDLCEKCHANDGTDVKDDAGVLAGQWTPYLRLTFQQYKAGKRNMEQKMKPKIKKLDDEGIEALLNYYASIK
jgi:cytochrome subunit of sulfide dehydrogenase